MFADIGMPEDNEAEFITIASKLGIKKLHFLYDFDEYVGKSIEKKLKSLETKGLFVQTMFMVSQRNANQAAKAAKFLAAKSSDMDRSMIEGKKIKMIFGFEENKKKDYMHQRASGLNHVLCELARKNNVTVGFSYASLIGNELAPQSMGRMMQNIILCRKYKVKTAVGSFSSNPYSLRSSHDVASLFSLLGMDGKMVKESFSFNV